MAMTSLAAQLQVIKSFVPGDSQPLKRPFTRPSILYDPKEAADIDIDTILSIALQGPPLTFLQQLVRFSVIISVKIDSHNSVSLFFQVWRFW